MNELSSFFFQVVYHVYLMFALDDAWGEDDAAPSSAAPEADAELQQLIERVELHGPAPPPPPKSQQTTANKPGGSKPPSAEVPVELGFVSPYPGARGAQPDHFPSKVGGAPVWLVPERLPQPERLCCGQCGRQLRFLMQLYCPRPEVEHAYHRSLMLFCCGGACLLHASAWRAFRCNVPADVPWYVEHPDGSWTAHGRERLLSEARGDEEVAAPRKLSPPPLPEMIISVAMEGDWRQLVSSTDADAIEQASRLLTAYEAMEGSGWSCAAGSLDQPQSARGSKGGGGSTPSVDEDEMIDDDDDDDAMEEGLFAFQRRTSAHPEQALRYNRSADGQPLWAAMCGRPPQDAPPRCERCGAPRTFEFQLMPQLLCALEEALRTGGQAADDGSGAEPSASAAAGGDATIGATLGATLLDVSEGQGVAMGGDDTLDWGVVAVYTCSASCAAPVPREGEAAPSVYAEEFCWHQPLA
jgi:pre-rRNA-processing protein TSR4